MKRLIWFSLLSIVIFIGLIGLANTAIVDAQPSTPDEVSASCGSDASQVGCWLFDEGSGTIITDGSDYGNNGTLVGDDGTMWVADRFGNPGKALHFNSSSQYVRIPDSSSLDITSDISIVAWVKTEKLKTQDIFKKAITTGSKTNGYELALTDLAGACATNPCAFGRFNQKTSGETFRIDASTTYTTTDTWTLYVVTYTTADNTLRMYRDGVLSNSNTPASLLTIATNTLYLGIGAQLTSTGVPPSSPQYFAGSLDDIRLYNRALSPTEILALYDLPTAVDVVGLVATSTANGIQLEWQSVQEVDLLGFNILRSSRLDGAVDRINPEAIPGMNPGQIKGNDYQYLDSTAELGKIYVYWVEWVGDKGSQKYGPEIAWLAPNKIWLPVGFR